MTLNLENELLNDSDEILPEAIPKKSAEEKPRNNLTKIIGTSLAIFLTAALCYTITRYSFPSQKQKPRIQYEENLKPNYWLNTELFGVRIKANWTELVYENKSTE